MSSVFTSYDTAQTHRVAPLLTAFGKEAGLKEPFATEEEFWKQGNILLELRLACTVIAEKNSEVIGVLGGIFAPRSYWPGSFASETFFWIVPQHRGGLTGARLLKEFEEEARRRGCAVVHVGHKHHFGAEEMARFYKRFGYSPMEVMYQKEL